MPGIIYKKSNKYFVMNEISSHCGRRYKFEWTKDINEATVFYLPPRQDIMLEHLKNAKALRVKLVKTVILLGDDE